MVGVTLMLIVPTGTLFSGMAAKNKFKGRGRNSISREDADLRDLLGLHFQACRRAEEVEEQIQELHAAGKFPEARVLRMHALGIEQGLRAIEAEVRAVVRPAKYPRPSLPAAQQTTTLLDELATGVPPPGSMLAPAGRSATGVAPATPMLAPGGPDTGVPPPGSMLVPAGRLNAAMPAAGSMLAPAGGRATAMQAAPMLGSALPGPAGPSFGADFKTTMDPGVTLEVTR